MVSFRFCVLMIVSIQLVACGSTFPTVPPPNGYDRCTTTFTSTTGGEQMVASLYNLVAAQTLVVKTPILNETTGLYYEFYINPCFQGDFMTKCGIGSRGYLAIVKIANVTGNQNCLMFNDYALPQGVTDKAKGVTYLNQLSAFVVNFIIANVTAQVVFRCNPISSSSSSAVVAIPSTVTSFDEAAKIITVETPLVCPTPVKTVNEQEVVLRSSSDRCQAEFIQTGGLNYKVDISKIFGIGRTFTIDNTVYTLSPCAQVLFESCGGEGSLPQSGYASYTNHSTGVCYVFHQRRATWDPLTLTVRTVFSNATTTNGSALPPPEDQGFELKVATHCGRKHNEASGVEEEGYLVITTDDACPSLVSEEDHHHHHDSDEGDIPTGAVVGITIGVIVAILVLIAMCRWTKKNGGASDGGQYGRV